MLQGLGDNMLFVYILGGEVALQVRPCSRLLSCPVLSDYLVTIADLKDAPLPAALCCRPLLSSLVEMHLAHGH